MTLDLQAMLRAADPAPVVAPYDDVTAAAMLQRAVNSTTSTSAVGPAGARTAWQSPRRRLVLTAVVVAAGAVAITVTMSLVSSPVASAGIELVREGDYYLVTITDPNRDPEALTAALTSKGLDITLQPEAVSPSLVGSIPWTVMPPDAEVTEPITALGPAPCTVPMTETSGCVVGLRIPVGFTGKALIAIGRAALPGEDYNTATSSLSPGEQFACQDLRGRPVPDVVAELHAAGTTVEYRGGANDSQDPAVYTDQYVNDVLPKDATAVYVFAQPTPPKEITLPDGC